MTSILGRKIVDANKALTAGSTVGLVLLNLAVFNALTAIAAIALAAAVMLHLKGVRFGDFEIFIFILAELSPISLHASLSIALVYQALSVALLVALCVPLNRLNGIATHKKAVPALLSLVLIPPALLAIMLYTRVLRYSTNQLFALATLALLGVVGAMLIVSQRDIGTIDGVES